MQELSDRGSSSVAQASEAEIFRPLLTYRYFIIVFTTAAGLSALAMTYIYSEKYEAQKTLVFKPTEVTRLRDHDTQAFGAPAPAAAYRIISTTLDDLTKSDLLLRKVVTQLHLDAPEPRVYTGPPYYRWYKMSKDWLVDVASDAWSILKYGRIIENDRTTDAIEALRKDIRIRSEDSQVFTLRVRDKQPDRVVAIANEITHQLMTLLREIQQRPATVRRVELQTLLAKKRFEVQDYQNKITDLLDRNHVASVAEEIEKGMYRYSQLLLAANNLDAEIKQSKATIAAYSRQLSARSSDGLQAQNRERLKTDEFRKLATDKAAAESVLSGLLAKHEALDQTIASLKDRLTKLPTIQAEYEELHAQVQRSERDYSLLNDALQEASIRERNAATELVIQNESQEAKEPATPIKVYHVLLSLVLALLLSSGLSFVLDFFHIKMFTPQWEEEPSSTGLEQAQKTFVMLPEA
jgi:uncharacterized protein involved in exopolysaccharide biosynthesis